MILGGAEEIGANSCYLNLDGTGLLIDAGLHPRDRAERALPWLEGLEHRPSDAVVITHAHTDHVGGLPYVLRKLPHVRTVMSHATRDLTHDVLHNCAKLLKSDVTRWFPKEALDYYKRDVIEMIRHGFEAVPYNEPWVIRGFNGLSDVSVRLHPAGHILGSASVHLSCNGMSILHTGDIQFDHQAMIAKAATPREHVDCLITEATNAFSDRPNDYAQESKRLAQFVNTVTNANGSVLIPSFALGKTQEILRTLYTLMRKGSIPQLPIYTGGLGVKISKVYDQHCYTEPMRTPGFEVSDIPQERIRFDQLFTADYMRKPSIVVASSGMVNKGTTSYALATAWLQKPNFGIAVIGYQDPETPGHALLHSGVDRPFDFGGRTMKRLCLIDRFRFSAHASLEGLLGLIMDVRPSTLCIVHGEPEACDHLALCVKERLPNTRIIIPRLGKSYVLEQGSRVARMGSA